MSCGSLSFRRHPSSLTPVDANVLSTHHASTVGFQIYMLRSDLFVIVPALVFAAAPLFVHVSACAGVCVSMSVCLAAGRSVPVSVLALDHVCWRLR